MRGIDIKEHEFAPPPVPPNIGGARGQADEFLLLDLRKEENCRAALSLPEGRFDEVHQLAADMGEVGFIGALTIHHWPAIIPLRLRAG